MVCKSCKKNITEIDIYCLSCGTPTENYKQHFSIKKTLQAAKAAAKADNVNLIFYYIPIALVLIVLVCITGYNVLSESYWLNYALLNISAIFIVPLLILPLSLVTKEKDDTPRLSQALKYYPKLLVFVALIALYFFALRTICQGDPILNLVRLVLVLWGIAIAFPVPFLIFTRDEAVFKSIKRGYIAGKYLRWHQFGMSLVLGSLLLVSIPLALVPLPTVMNFTGHLMYIWHKKQDEFQLYDKQKGY